MAALLLPQPLPPARAATASASFSVGAEVIGGCTIQPRRLSQRPAWLPCAPSAAAPTQAAPPQPTVTITRDPASDVATLTLIF